MKYIEVIDTAYFDEIIDTAYFGKNDSNNSFIVAVSEDKYESLKSDLDHILSNQEDYDNVWEAMMETIEKHEAKRIRPDFSLEW